MKSINKVLIVVHNRIVAFDIKNICERLGLLCSYGSPNTDLLICVKNNSAGLLIMDIIIGRDQNLLDEAEIICNSLKIPIIFFTTVPGHNIKKERLAGRCIFLTLPFIQEDLSNSINYLEKKYIYY